MLRFGGKADGPRCLLCGDTLTDRYEATPTIWSGSQGVRCTGNRLALANGEISYGSHVACAVAPGVTAKPRLTVIRGGLSG